jgi:hypothetical protein
MGPNAADQVAALGTDAARSLHPPMMKRGSNADGETGVRVDDCQHAQFAASGSLIVRKIHGPGFVDLGCSPSVLPQLRLDPALR